MLRTAKILFKDGTEEQVVFSSLPELQDFVVKNYRRHSVDVFIIDGENNHHIFM